MATNVVEQLRAALGDVVIQLITLESASLAPVGTAFDGCCRSENQHGDNIGIVGHDE